MIKVILIDDEPHICSVCRILLEKLEDVHVVAECNNIKDAYEEIIRHNPDLILLDIQLSGETGLDLLEKFDSPDFVAVIITSFDEYAIRALKAGAIDYLLKPIIADEFYLAIEKARKRNALNNLQIKGAVNNFTGDFSKITLSGQNYTILVDYKDLIYCKSDGGYTTFYLSNGKEVVTSKVLKHYEAILPDEIFLRCHQSYLINLHHIVSLKKSNAIILSNGMMVPISIRKGKDLRDRLRELG